jgi:hypothetical protein
MSWKTTLARFDRGQPRDHFSRGSSVESTHWKVLHRPPELAAVTGQVESWYGIGPVILPSEGIPVDRRGGRIARLSGMGFLDSRCVRIVTSHNLFACAKSCGGERVRLSSALFPYWQLRKSD